MTRLFSVKTLILLNLFVFAFCIDIIGQSTVYDVTGTLDESTVYLKQDSSVISNTSAVDLNRIRTLRQMHDMNNATFTVRSVAVSDEEAAADLLEPALSEEALYWINYRRTPDELIPENLTYQDTAIVDPLFLPLFFKGEVLPDDLQLYDRTVRSVSNYKNSAFENLSDTIFSEEMENVRFATDAYRYIQDFHPEYFRYTIFELPDEQITANIIEKKSTKDVQIEVKNEADFSDVTGPDKFVPERRYWTTNFESSAQLSQNYVSPNWYKGGSSNLNIYIRNYFKYNYNRDKLKITNDAELKIGVNNAPNDTLHTYIFTENLLKLRSNVGYQAFDKWYYTLDTEFSTNMFTTYNTNSYVKKVTFLSPANINIGLGMKYDLNKTYAKNNRSLKLALNFAPLSYVYQFSTDSAVIIYTDPTTQEKKLHRHQLGSTLRADMTFQMFKNAKLTSRFYYFTSYNNVTSELENTLDLTLSRFFSTRIYLLVRYDDNVAKSYKDPEKTELYDTHFQTNQILSFGFSYKW